MAHPTNREYMVLVRSTEHWSSLTFWSHMPTRCVVVTESGMNDIDANDAHNLLDMCRANPVNYVVTEVLE